MATGLRNYKMIARSAIGTIFRPGLDDIAGSLSSQAFYSLFFGDLSGTIGDHSHFLSPSFIASFNVNRLNACERAERRTDVLFAAPSSYAGHAGNVSDFFCNRRGGECEGQHSNCCQYCFHQS